MLVKINIAEEFSPVPIGRHREDSPYSGQDFREQLLVPRFREALEKRDTLVIDLGGMTGLGTPFLEEAFGGLVREIRKNPGREEAFASFGREITRNPETILGMISFDPEGTYFDPYIDTIRGIIREAAQES